MGFLNSRTIIALAAAWIALILVNCLKTSFQDTNILCLWIVAQWLPMTIKEALHAQAWSYWEEKYGSRKALAEQSFEMPIPVVDVQEHKDNLLPYLETTFGKDWRKRLIKLQNLWSESDLANPNRRLSVEGLLKENLTIPYFTDARRKNALSPDAAAPISSIVSNITQGSPHKIGTQFIVQKYPGLIEEIAPRIVTTLFGDFFTPDNVRGFGPGLLLPPLTTVPVFVASGSSIQQPTTAEEDQPFTALHCEPIGNVAVQLSGSKTWTLVDPMFSFMLNPSTSPDGRAFFASFKDIRDINVPYYVGTTSEREALWVPTWTWHRVDYDATDSKEISIGGSLFHFRLIDFFANNALFGMLIIPAILQELIGIKTQ